ncbi:MAG: sugar kinase [Beijerinckiaceae bacterium]|nr:sugar kinase [Beijerinckiaceae bacterium]
MEFSALAKDGETVYKPGFGGDTSNAVIAAARQGARTAYFSAVGADPFGASFLKLWDRESVDRSTVIVRETVRTGIYFITYSDHGHEFTYWRNGSAASLMSVAELPRQQIGTARVLHVSGISQAISPSASDAVAEAISIARDAGTLVSYDTNLRLKLWSLEQARKTIHAAVARSDIARPGLDDARQLTGLDGPEEICRFYLDLGPSIVALTMGSKGTMVMTRGETRVIEARPVKAVDATGAGDTFDGSFLAEYLRTHDPFAAAAWANCAAALSTQGYGAVDPMPTRAETAAFIAGRQS